MVSGSSFGLGLKKTDEFKSPGLDLGCTAISNLKAALRSPKEKILSEEVRKELNPDTKGKEPGNIMLVEYTDEINLH